MKTFQFLAFVCVLVFSIFVNVASSYESYSEQGFQPHPGYYRSIDQMAEASERLSSLQEPADEGNSISSTDKRTQRFGISTYGGTGVQSTYPSGTGSTGLYGPVKIDLGGVLLGSLIGLGAILILPKLIGAFSNSYGGGYGRSLEDDMNTFAALLSKVEETLEKSNVDSSSCAQRITCSYVQTSMDNVSVGNATDIDRLIATISNNSLVDYMLDGTSIKQAVELGKDRHTDCQSLYPKCQLDKKTLMKILSNVIP